MGADLYIQSVSKKCQEKYHPSFERACAARDSACKNATLAEQTGKPVKGKTADQWKERQEILQRRVTTYYDLLYSRGYYRDSYNGTNLLWVLGISYWEDIQKMTNKKGYMNVQRMKALRDRLAETKVPRITKKYLKEKGCTVDRKENTVQTWQKYFEDKKASFIRFLDMAIELKEPIYCSV